MTEKQIIDELLSQGRVHEAIEALSANIECDPSSAQWRLMRGKAYWKLGERGKAISDYEHAAQLDPESPAVAALEMSRQVMDYFNPDLLNP